MCNDVLGDPELLEALVEAYLTSGRCVGMVVTVLLDETRPRLARGQFPRHPRPAAGPLPCKEPTMNDPLIGEAHAWRIARQFFRYADLEVGTEPWGDGYVLTIHLGLKRRKVFFDPAGRITHVRSLNDPSQPVPVKVT